MSINYCPNCPCESCRRMAVEYRKIEDETRERRRKENRRYDYAPSNDCPTCGGVIGNNWDTCGCTCGLRRP